MKKQNIWMGSAALGLLIFHLFTLTKPLWTYDDGCAADYAIHGTLSTWAQLLPLHYKYFVNFYGLWDSWFFFFAGVRTALRILGVGLFQVRAFPFLIHYAALMGILLVLKKTESPRLAVLGLFYYMLSSFFFAVAHSVRPEGMILGLMVLNFVWILSPRGHWESCLVGLATSLGFGFHSNAAFIFVLVPILIFFLNGWRALRKDNFIFWTLGVVCGLLIFLIFLPVDNVLTCLQLHSTRLSPDHMPLLVYKWNQGAIFMEYLKLWTTRLGAFCMIFSPWQAPIIGLHVFALSTQLRNWKALPPVEKGLLVMAVSLIWLFAWFTPHQQPKYLPLLFPWIYANTSLMLARMLTRKFIFDSLNTGLFFGSQFLALIPFASANASKAKTILRIAELARHKPFLGISIFLFVLISFALVGLWLIFKKKSPQRILPSDVAHPILLSFILFVLWGNFLSESMDIYKIMQQPILLEKDRAEFKIRGREGRIVAPNFFWLLEPSIEVQCPISLLHLRHTFPEVSFASCLSNYYPLYALWPVGELQILQNDLKDKRFSNIHITVEDIPVKTGLGDYDWLKFSYGKN